MWTKHPHSQSFGAIGEARRVVGVKYFRDGRKYEVERIHLGKRYCCWESEVDGIVHLIRAFERRQRHARLSDKEHRINKRRSASFNEDDEDSNENCGPIDNHDNTSGYIVVTDPSTPGNVSISRSQDGLSPKVYSSKRNRIPCRRYLDFEEDIPVKKRLKRSNEPHAVIRPSLTSTPIYKKSKTSSTPRTPVKGIIIRTVSSTSKGRPSTKAVCDDFMYHFEDQEGEVVKKPGKELDSVKFYLEQSSQINQCYTPKSSFKSSMSSCSTTAGTCRSSSSSEKDDTEQKKDKITIKLQNYKTRGIKPNRIQIGERHCIVEFLNGSQIDTMLVSADKLSNVFSEEYRQHYEEKKLSSRRNSLLSDNSFLVRRSSILDSSFDDTCSRYSLYSSRTNRLEITLDMQPISEDEAYEDLTVDPEVRKLMESILVQIQESRVTSKAQNKKKMKSPRRLETIDELQKLDVSEYILSQDEEYTYL
jgi:hypothetical protein